MDSTAPQGLHEEKNIGSYEEALPTTSRSSFAEASAYVRSNGHGPADHDGAAGLHKVAELARRSLGCQAAVVRVFDTAQAGGEQSPVNARFCAASVSRGSGWTRDVPLDPCGLSDPLIADDLGFRFYAGIPLRTSGGETVGVLAALDLEPRELADGELETLNLLAAVAAELAEARFAGNQ